MCTTPPPAVAPASTQRSPYERNAKPAIRSTCSIDCDPPWKYLTAPSSCSGCRPSVAAAPAFQPKSSPTFGSVALAAVARGAGPRASPPAMKPPTPRARNRNEGGTFSCHFSMTAGVGCSARSRHSSWSRDSAGRSAPRVGLDALGRGLRPRGNGSRRRRRGSGRAPLAASTGPTPPQDRRPGRRRSRFPAQTCTFLYQPSGKTRWPDVYLAQGLTAPSHDHATSR